MKKLLFAAFLLTSIASTAQFTLKTLDGTVINNGDVFSFTGLAEPNNYLGFKIYNTNSYAISLKAQVVSISNFDPAAAETNALCFDPFCNYNVVAGTSYSTIPLTVPANGENGDFDYFENMNPGLNPALPVEYVLRIYQLSSTGGDSEISVTFTYRYVPALSTGTFGTLAAAGIAVNATQITDRLEVRLQQDVHVQLFDVNGKSVLAQDLSAGDTSIDCSALRAGVYIANFTNAGKQLASVKVLKK